MEGLFNDFYSNGALLILWAGLLVHRLLPLSREFHPTTIWRKFAIQLLLQQTSMRHIGVTSLNLVSIKLLWFWLDLHKDLLTENMSRTLQRK